MYAFPMAEVLKLFIKGVIVILSLAKAYNILRFVSDKSDISMRNQMRLFQGRFCQSRPKWVRTMWPTKAAVCCWVGVVARRSLLTNDKAMVNGGEPIWRNW